MRTLLVAALVVLPVSAFADDADTVVRSSAKPEAQGKNLFYAEVLGKAGLYGVGYERAITGRLSLGVAGSFAVIRDQQLTTVAPYVHTTIVRGRRNALFSEIGAVIAHSRLPSPVDGWEGMSDTGGGGFLSFGWEYATRHVSLRASGSLVVGEGGLGPMVGLAIGFRP